ncbi:MAG: 6,7-dimethyl-8-ribityllumazine synthase [Methanomassiliicoccaceae archaeon]|nr:6,7-dimethyl-8-ribityllumazine synthase [Methanomassiliicoccaceae archaeon]
MKKYKLGMVAAEFNFDITSMMIERAKSEAEFLEIEIARTIMVPGVFDMPLAVKKLLEEKDIDAVITLGAVIEGETEHDDVVIAHASRKIADLSLEYNKPVAFGVTGPGMTRLQAVDRIDKGKDVVDVAVKMLKRLSK